MDMKEVIKKNGKMNFRESTHTYWSDDDPSAKFTSVTTLIHSFTQPFDSDFWSAYKALEKLLDKDTWAVEKKSLMNSKKFDKTLLEIHNISEDDFNREQQAILDEWERKNKEACERGTAIHLEMENMMYDTKHNIDLSKFEIGGKFECIKDKTDLDLENGVYPEYLIHRISEDGKLRIAGQIDLLIKRGNHIVIGDYKGLPLDTKIPTPTGWSTIKDLKEGDFIFDKDGNPTKILHKSDIHHNPCFKLHFDNGDNIIVDHEHRWEITFKVQKSKKYPQGFKTCVMTTEELYAYLENIPKRRSALIPKILNPKPINCNHAELPIDPYVLGVWLGDGSKACGIITQRKGSNIWKELQKRGYVVGPNCQHNPNRKNVEMRTVYGLVSCLRKLNLVGNKHIPEIYQRASISQRIDLLRGLMDTDGYYNKSRKRFVMSTGQLWQKNDLEKLLASLGIKTATFESVRRCNNKYFKAWDVCFSTDSLNPFLTRNQDIIIDAKQNHRDWRNIIKVEPEKIVPTQCLEVDSPTHTFLCTEHMIVTHNTNASIDMKSYYDSKTKSSQKMQFPLNNLEDCNYFHYAMQLSTYAWMIQKLNPDYIIDDLVLVHFPHEGGQVIYHLPYLREEVIRMLAFYKKKIILDEGKKKRQRIEY